MKKILLALTASMLLLTGCANMKYGSSSNTQITDPKEAISIAKMKYKEVHEAGIAWQKTKSKIKKAEELLKKGDDKNALAFANEAIYEAEQAKIQAIEAEKTWQNAVPQ